MNETTNIATNFTLEAPEDYSLLTDNESLNTQCRAWQGSDFLAIDTEFIRTSTFFPKIGLVQICDGQKNYLIDPLTIDDWSLFKELMQEPSLVKVFHSCSEDLLVFFAFLELIPTPIFDTQIANAFLDDGFGLSYQNLVNLRKNIDLPKGETRSDWLQRPLTSEQLKYAALDVAYLPEIYMWQKAQLQANNKLTWLEQECERLTQTYISDTKSDFNEYYLSMKSAWQLKGYQLEALKQLAAWREIRARKRDKPRSWIIKDNELVAIAKLLPSEKHEIANIQGIPGNFAKYEGSAIIEIIQSAKALTEDKLPNTLPPPLTSGQRNTIKKAQKFCESKAQTLSLPIELLARKRCLIALLVNVIAYGKQEEKQEDKNKAKALVIPEELQGWRKPLVLEELIEIMQ